MQTAFNNLIDVRSEKNQANQTQRDVVNCYKILRETKSL